MTASPLLQMTRLNMQLSGLITALDIDLLGKQTTQTVQLIKQLGNDARLDVRDWEMSETKIEMAANAREGRQRLEELRTQILKASEHGIFNAIDVVHLTAQLDSILAELY